MSVTATLHARDYLPTLLPEWEALRDRAVEPNVYFSPEYALPLLNHVELTTEVSVIALRYYDKLVGFFPVTRSLGVPGLKPSGHAWQSLYSFTATPLFDPEHLDTCATALVSELRKISSGEWVIPTIQSDGPVAKAICNALEKQHAPHLFLNAFERASLATGQTFEEHMKQHLSNSLRKNLTKRRRKLEESKKVEYRHCQTAEDLDQAVAAFLEIEGRGWKGKRGTALINDPESMAFGIEAFGGNAAGSARADMLLADGKPIAVILTAICGNTGFTVKNAYDEDYADVSAGLLLEVEFLKNVLSTKWVEKLDSGTNGKHVIDNFWPGRLHMADLAFSFAKVFAKQRLQLFEKRNTAIAELKPKLKKLLGRD
jgi:CelD/BcsL family acetyltransferase involved in cellulose biosynthesis